MCDRHSLVTIPDDTSWPRKIIMRIYANWIEDTLGFYLAMGKMTTIPVVGRAVRFFARHYGRYYHGGRAATVDECLEIIDSAQQISLMDCACRVREKKCKAPVKTCITVNTGAETFRTVKNGESISKAKAAEIIRESCKHGLIRALHYCIAPNTYAICNCCTCCCIPFKLRTEYSIDTAVENGLMIAEIDKKRCQQCGGCQKACPQKAIFPAEKIVRAEDCLGCGLCAAECQFNAVRMAKRDKGMTELRHGRAEKALIFAVFIAFILPLGLAFRLLNKIRQK